MVQFDTASHQQDFITKNCSLTIDNDGIVQALYTSDAKDNPALSASNTSLLKEYYQGEPFPLLLDISSVRTLTSSLHNYFYVDTAVKQYAAVAFVVASPIGHIIANVFIGLYRPVLRVEVFTSRDAALAWLRPFSLSTSN